LASDQPVGELSYWLVPEARGGGLAVAAVRMMLRSIVAKSGLRSVVLDIETTNAASVRLADRLRAQRRDPTRVELDRSGTPRTLAVFVLAADGG
jgi:RimJ/RimL family protein N-acetyltransferase